MNTRTTIPVRADWACLLGLQAALLMLVGIQTLYREMIGGRQLDVVHFYSIANALLRGDAPYRDFLLEYPPFSIIAFLLPRLAVFGVPELGAYLWAMLLQCVLMSTWIGILVIRMTERWNFPLGSGKALATYVALVALGSLLLPWRYDVFPALLTAFAVHALLAGRPTASGCWLGLGIAAKIYPGALLPVFACYLLIGKGREQLARFLVACLSAVAACLIPFLIIGPACLLGPLRYHQMRGFEIESVVAGFAFLARAFGLLRAGVVFNYGAVHVDAAGLEPLRRAFPYLSVGAFALFTARCHRVMRREFFKSGSISPTTTVRFAAAGILLFIVSSKVFSPQYVFWLLPFAPLLRPRAAIAVSLIFLLTALIYPLSFRALVGAEPAAVALLNLRNLLVLMTLASLLLEPGEKTSG